MDRYIVVESWRSDYPNPVILKQGQKVVVDNTEKVDDPEWEGWVWCVTEDNAGWVPFQILDIDDQNQSDKPEATVLEDYSAEELNVETGEFVKGERTLNGWLWCVNENDNCGWLPLRNIEIIS